MFLEFISFLSSFEELLWSYVAFPAFLITGIFLTWKSRAVQIRKIPWVVKNFFSFFCRGSSCESSGVHPLKTFFACIGGCVGIGNVVGIALAVKIGGPGAVFWIWVTAFIGAIVKYCDVFLGMMYRVKVSDGWRGGPMYVLRKAFSQKWLVSLFCFLMCLYCVEIFQFSVATTNVAYNIGISKHYVALFFLALVAIAELGGVNRVGTICSAIIPAFIFIYLGLGLYVIGANIDQIPHVFGQIFTCAFTGHAAVGGFVGSTLLLAASQGMSSGCYSCDIGVGYASIIHSESSNTNPHRQAALTIFDVLLDTFGICTMSALIVLVTGAWTTTVDPTMIIQQAFSNYFPYMNWFIPILLSLLGYSVVTTYFCAGMKTASFLSPRWGRTIYYIYSAIILTIFSFVDTECAKSVMFGILAMLLLLNLSTTWRMRRMLNFDLDSQGEGETLREEIAVN